jgi:hypothetical protein
MDPIYFILSRIFIVATRDLQGPDGQVAQIIFRFRSGQISNTIYSNSNWVGPNCLWAGPGKILKFRPVQTSTA